MKITFRIQYRTVWGESLCIFLNQQQIQHTVEMTTRNGEEWTGEANFDFLSSAPSPTAMPSVCTGRWCGKSSEPSPTLSTRATCNSSIISLKTAGETCRSTRISTLRPSTTHIYRNSRPNCPTMPGAASLSGRSVRDCGTGNNNWESSEAVPPWATGNIAARCG